MCNNVGDAVKISRSGYGWKLFSLSKVGKYKSLCGEVPYFNSNSKGVVVGQWSRNTGFCFFPDKEVAETWAEYWNIEGFGKPVVLKIQYWGGKGKRVENYFIGWRGGVDIALCKSFRIVDKESREYLGVRKEG